MGSKDKILVAVARPTTREIVAFVNQNSISHLDILSINTENGQCVLLYFAVKE